MAVDVLIGERAVEQPVVEGLRGVPGVGEAVEKFVGDGRLGEYRHVASPGC
ncbi:MAG: hypothetical protein WDN31_17670 [Hyphomicrobium sp.]